MSVILAMLHKNRSLSEWESWADTGIGAGFFSQKNSDKLAQQIFNQLSHPKAVALVAKEFEQLPPDLRLRIRTLCNDGNASGNVRKGVQRLDQLLGGKLLRDEQHVQYQNIRVESVDGVRFKRKAVNQAAAGAQRKYISR